MRTVHCSLHKIYKCRVHIEKKLQPIFVGCSIFDLQIYIAVQLPAYLFLYVHCKFHVYYESNSCEMIESYRWMIENKKNAHHDALHLNTTNLLKMHYKNDIWASDSTKFFIFKQMKHKTVLFNCFCFSKINAHTFVVTQVITYNFRFRFRFQFKSIMSFRIK